VQPTPLPQQGWPSLPQVPPLQPPLVHTPWLLLQELPAATHCWLEPSQQLPVPHTLPGQQNAPPEMRGHCSHFPEMQVAPVAVQKSPALPPPGQQLSPTPPQVDVAPTHSAFIQAPSALEQALAVAPELAMQRPPTQQPEL
jgi:hypothetical protein